MIPEKVKELADKKQLPTQLTISVNSPNKELYLKFHRSSIKNAWEKLNETLEILSGLAPLGVPQNTELRGKSRTVVRMNLVRNLNMEDKHVKEYAELIKKAKPMFVHVKGFMSVGFARQRLGYERMPTDKEMMNFVNKLAKETGLKLLDKHERSRAYVLGKNKENLKIKNI